MKQKIVTCCAKHIGKYITAVNMHTHTHKPHKGFFSVSTYSSLTFVNKRACKVKGCVLLFSFVWLCLHDWKDYQIGLITLFGGKGKWVSVCVCFGSSSVKAVPRNRQTLWAVGPRECVKSTGWHNKPVALPQHEIAWHYCKTYKTNVDLRGHEATLWTCRM